MIKLLLSQKSKILNNLCRIHMDSISAFDFSNEGDCILANESLKPHASDVLSGDEDFTFSYMDLMMLRASCDMMFNDVKISE